jgi:hypothetical protein
LKEGRLRTATVVVNAFAVADTDANRPDVYALSFHVSVSDSDHDDVHVYVVLFSL